MATVSNKGGRPRSKAIPLVGRRIDAALESKGLTRHELADRIGITYTSLYLIIMGKNRPRLSTAMKLSKVLGQSVGHLFS